MRRKIFISLFLPLVAVLAIGFSVFFFYTYEFYGDRAVKELRRDAEYIKSGYQKFGEDFFENPESTLHIIHISPDGSLLYDSETGEGAASESYLEQEEIIKAFNTGEGYAERISDSLSVKTIYYALKLNDGSVIRVAAPAVSAVTVLSEVLAPMLLIFLLATVLAMLLSAYIAKSIVKPINEIDPENPDISKIYEELHPMAKKLASQNAKISSQMSLLRRREREFNSITFNMREGMVVINSRAAILSCNRSAREIFSAEGEPKSILELNSTPSFREAVRLALSGENGYDSFKKGERYYSIFATPVLHETAVEGAIIVVLDETEREARESLRREFTSNISHELKTPLTSISGFAEIIKSGMSDGEDTRHFAENIHKEASRLIALVGDIIRLSRLDGGEIPYDSEPVELARAAREVCDRLALVAQKSRVELICDAESPVLADGNSLIAEEIIYNLCDNGIKYNRPGGYVKVSVYYDGGRACITVSDNGIGIPKDKQDRVFERFYRVDKSHSKSIGGTGLGLSIVKHAAAYHKAEVSIESREGEGTKITVKFPLSEK